MGLFDVIKNAFKSTPREPRPSGKNAGIKAPTTGIPGWAPLTNDPAVAMVAHKLMSWVIHPDFSLSSYLADEFQDGIGTIEAAEATPDLIEVLKRAAISIHDHAPLWRRLALVYTKNYDNTSAATIWRDLLADEHYLGEANHMLGEISEREGKLVEAAAYYQRAIVFDATRLSAWQRADNLKVHIPMPRKAAAATLGGDEAGAQLQGLGIRAPEGYELRHPLGRGGYGTVYLANDVHLHRDVAIKFLHPHLTRDARRVQAFFEEAKLVARLSLPGVVRIHDLDEPSRIIVMEYLTRGTLRDRLSSGRALAPAAALRVVISLLKTLHSLHESGVIHRDLKPENILFRSDGSAVLGDFGVASLEDAVSQGRAAGTLAYMAPEQKDTSIGPIDRRSDLYAVGLVLVEMLAGCLPVGAASMIHAPEVFLSLLPSHLRDTLSGTLSALLSTDPKGRPQAARDVSAALVAASRILAAQKQTAELVDELRRVVDSAAPQDLSTRTELEAMLAALRLE